MTPELAPPIAVPAAPAASIYNAGRGKLLLTKRQLSEETGLPPRTIERLTANGVIPALRITSKLLRFELHAVLTALRRYETSTLGK